MCAIGSYTRWSAPAGNKQNSGSARVGHASACPLGFGAALRDKLKLVLPAFPAFQRRFCAYQVLNIAIVLTAGILDQFRQRRIQL